MLRQQHVHLCAAVKMSTDALSPGQPVHGKAGEDVVLTYSNRLANEVVHTAAAIPAPRGRLEALPLREQAAAREVSR